MANASISQIKVGNITYDICDPITRESNDINVKQGLKNLVSACFAKKNSTYTFQVHGWGAVTGARKQLLVSAVLPRIWTDHRPSDESEPGGAVTCDWQNSQWVVRALTRQSTTNETYAAGNGGYYGGSVNPGTSFIPFPKEPGVCTWRGNYLYLGFDDVPNQTTIVNNMPIAVILNVTLMTPSWSSIGSENYTEDERFWDSYGLL